VQTDIRQHSLLRCLRAFALPYVEVILQFGKLAVYLLLEHWYPLLLLGIVGGKRPQLFDEGWGIVAALPLVLQMRCISGDQETALSAFCVLQCPIDNLRR